VIVLLLAGCPSSTPAVRNSPQEGALTDQETRPPALNTWFDPDPNHPWNQLRECLFVRTADDGTVYRREELEPPIQALSKHLLEGLGHQRAIAVLDDFRRRRADQLIRDPLKRAVLQRDLWAVFGITAGTGATHFWEVGDQLLSAGIEDTGDEQFGRKPARRELQRRLVAVMRDIALSPQEISALPDNLLNATNSHAFPAAADPDHPERAYLPVGLGQTDGPWVPVSNTERADGLAAPCHVQFTNGRSLFLVFMRLPGGREATEAYLAKIGNGKWEQFPEGTEVALVRRMLLIDTSAGICVSPLTEDVQLRVFRHLDTVDAYSFLLSRKDLFAGQCGGFRVIEKGETSYYDISGFEGGSPTGSADLLEARPQPPAHLVMDCCVTCHRFHGEGGIGSVVSAFASGRRYPDLQPVTQESQIRFSLDWAKKTYSWGLLQGLWDNQQ
jgi:hypothetical protein